MANRTGEVFATWVFVMTLAWSRHQCVQLVRDQKVPTWLGCHRRAFEWFHSAHLSHLRRSGCRSARRERMLITSVLTVFKSLRLCI